MSPQPDIGIPGRRPNGLRTLACAVVMSALVAAPMTASAASDKVPAKLAAQLHIKLLSYDKALKTRTQDIVRIGVAVVESKGESTRDGDAMLEAFRTLARTATVQGLKLEITRVALGADVKQSLQASGVGVVYVSAGLSSRLAEVREASKTLELPTLSRSREDCAGGLAVAIVPKANRPSIVVNLAAAKAAGMQLSPSVLRLAEVLR